jgi:hypothetical protein
MSKLTTAGRLGAIAADIADPTDPIDFWTKKNRWPSQLFEPGMEQLPARKRSLSALSGCERSNSASSATPSDQRPREEKGAQYRDPRYETLLAMKGSFMVKSKIDVASESKTLCKKFLEREQTLPEDSHFHDIFSS